LDEIFKKNINKLKTTVFTQKPQNIGLNEQIDVHNSYLESLKNILEKLLKMSSFHQKIKVC
jgi:hypothetical protein